MTSAQLPTTLTLIDGAMAMDGGSLGLQATDQAGKQILLRLDWSIRDQTEGTTQFYVDDNQVPRGSPDEADWLALLREAAIRRSSASPNLEGTRISANRLVLAEDVDDYFRAIEYGPEAAISWLASRLVMLVSSATYQERRTPPKSPSPQERIQSLVMEGKTAEAVRAYREAHPDVGMMAARAAIQLLAAEVERAAHRDTTGVLCTKK